MLVVAAVYLSLLLLLLLHDLRLHLFDGGWVQYAAAAESPANVAGAAAAAPAAAVPAAPEDPTPVLERSLAGRPKSFRLLAEASAVGLAAAVAVAATFLLPPAAAVAAAAVAAAAAGLAAEAAAWCWQASEQDQLLTATERGSYS